MALHAFYVLMVAVSTLLCSSQCDLIPGAQTMQTGFDAVKGEFAYTPIFAWTFDLDYSWTNPQETDKVYSVPDQMYVVNNPFTEQQSSSHIFEDARSNQYYQAQNSGLSISEFQIGMFADSSATKSLRSTISQDRFGASTHLRTGAFNQVLTGDLRSFLNEDFRSEMNSLPEQIESDYDRLLYRSFLGRYGTHFATNVLLRWTPH